MGRTLSCGGPTLPRQLSVPHAAVGFSPLPDVPLDALDVAGLKLLKDDEQWVVQEFFFGLVDACPAIIRWLAGKGECLIQEIDGLANGLRESFGLLCIKSDCDHFCLAVVAGACSPVRECGEGAGCCQPCPLLPPRSSDIHCGDESLIACLFLSFPNDHMVRFEAGLAKNHANMPFGLGVVVQEEHEVTEIREIAIVAVGTGEEDTDHWLCLAVVAGARSPVRECVKKGRGC